MYNKFVFPGFIIRSCSKGTESEGEEESPDHRFVSEESNNRCVFSSSSVGINAKTLEREEYNWVVQTSDASDLIVKVGDSGFLIHKLPMISRSGYLNRLVFTRSNNEGRYSKVKLQIDNIPGGARIFELVVRFCYGWNVDLTSFNIAPLYCAAHFLEMTDDFEQGNLVSKTEAFLSFLIFSSWKETFRVLKSCEPVSFWAKELKIHQRCAESISLKVSTNLKDFGSEEDRDDWWVEDVSCLRIDHFVEVIQSLRSKGMKPELIGSCIAQWTTKWLSGITLDLDDITASNPKNMKHQLLRVTTECLIRVLPTEDDSVGCNFLLRLLKVGLAMQTNSVLLEPLERRIANMLSQCRVPDLLVKNYGVKESVYDVSIVSRVVGNYVSCDPSNLMISPKLFAIGRLVDGYLALVARDENLEPQDFQMLAEVLPTDARYCDDNLYRATDMYLKAHPGLTEEERTRLCRFLKHHRLSTEAREHAMKNNRLPLEFSRMFFNLVEQVNMTRSKITLAPSYQRTKTRAFAKANGKSLRKVSMSSQKELESMAMEVEAMKSQLDDLHKCKLRLIGKLKRCRV